MEQINLNLIPNGILAVCHVSQYDNTGRKIRFHLFNGSDTYALSGTETITLRIRKTNGEILIFDIPNTASDYIELTVLQQMTDVSGDSVCEFRLTDSGLDIGSFNFKMKIEPDAFDGNLSISEVSGNIVTFKTDLAEDLIKLDVDLEPIQDLHGYDGAWRTGIINQITVNRTKGDAGAYGPNVTRDWDYTKYYVGWSYNNYYSESMITSYDVGNDIVSVTKSRNAYGIAFPVGVKPNHQYYIGCTFGGTVKLAASYFDSTGSLITYDYNIGASRTITTPNNCSTLVLVVYDGAASGVPVSASNIFINDPATETSYIPYSNICPITGYDSAVLNRVGKNLLHNVLESTEVNGTTIIVNEDKSITVSGTPSTRVRVYINDLDHIKFGKKTRFNSGTMPSGTRVFCSRKINGSVDYPTISPALTLQPNIEYYNFILEINTSYDGSAFTIYPQLEPGEVATSYEPYKSDPTPITVYFGQTIYEGHLDSTNRKVLVTKKGVKIKDLTWSYVSSFTYFSATVSDIASNTDAGRVLDGLMCEVYTNRTPTQAGSGNKNGSIAGFYNALRIKDLAYDNKDDLINAVGDYLIVYPLAEPFYIDLTQPVPAGINKLPFEDVIQEGWTNTISDVTATYSNGVVHVEGTNNSGEWANIVLFINAWANDPIVLPAGTYIMSENLVIRCSIDGGSYANKSNSFTAESSVVVQGFYVSVKNGDTVDWEIPLMFINGTTRPTEYFPYYVTADPIRIPALVGTNNVYSDAGNVDVEYYTTLEGGND